MAKPADNSRGLNPFQALTHLANVITTIDSFLEERTLRQDVAAAHHRIIYVRNTLCVTLDLWQEDIHRRLNRSKNGFYVYCMTDPERQAFLRRIEPSLRFAAEELGNIQISSMRHLMGMIEKSTADAVFYATDNRASIILGLEGLKATPPFFSYAPKALVSDQESRPASKAASG